MVIIYLLCFLVLMVTTSTAQLSTFGCGDTKGCILSPQGCQANNCLRAFTYTRITESVLEMELMAQIPDSTNGYVAIGFSRDTEMGDDTVTECASFNDSPFQGSLSYNPGKYNKRVNSTDEQAPILQTVEARYENGRVYCKLRQQIQPSGNLSPNQVQSLDSSFYILMATGRTANNALQRHSLDRSSTDFPFSTAQLVDLTQFPRTRDAPLSVNSGIMDNGGGPLTANVPLRVAPTDLVAAPETEYVVTLIKVHGILMVLAWMVFITISLLYTRYLRGNWPNTTIFGVHLWFHVHRTLNIIAIVATIAGFVCIFVAKDWLWVGPKATQSQELNREWNSVHAMLGLLACVVAWAQPIGAVFRCDPQAKLRFIFHAVHGFFGFGAWVMAASAIMIACVHFDPRFLNREAAFGLFIAFLCVIGLTMIINELMTVYQWWQRRHTVVSSDMEMIQVNGKIHVTVSPENQKINRIRLAIVGFASLIAVGTAVAISAMIGTVKPPPQ